MLSCCCAALVSQMRWVGTLCRKKGGGDGPDKDKLKVIGAGVAVAAALIFGGVKVYKV